MYRPVQGIAGIAMLAAQLLNPPALAQLLKRTVTDLATERALRQAIRGIGEIGDEVSQAVRGMYEENPYPRWFTLDRWRPFPFAEWLAREVPMLAAAGDVAAAPRILVAGCGTGQDAIWLATGIAGARVLAVDLSLASLAYAQRMASELGANNIEFRHGDILGLSDLAERFDLVYSKGVLQHMREPAAGMRVLSNLLLPGGLLKVGLYSERARASVNAARAIIRERQIVPGAAAIREFRQHIYATAPDSPLRALVGLIDFYSLSMCRDLIFRVQEHQFRLPQVVAMLRDSGLAVLGLSDLPRNAVAAYCRKFPGADVAAGFQDWDAFEAENPETFMSMYQVWSRRPASADASP
jgi:SAM-dependent methyltransferase